MWARNPFIRVVSIVPVGLIVTIFGFELFAYDGIFVFHGLGRWVGESKTVALLRVFAFNTAWVIAFWSYLRCSFSDPGFVPEWLDCDDRRRAASSIFGWQPGRSTECRKCNATRPERAHHCAVCGKCVMRMDHHCPWVGNCVGVNNHKYFILMLHYGITASLMFAFSAKPVIEPMFFTTKSKVTVGHLSAHQRNLFGMGAVLAGSFSIGLLLLYVSHLWLMAVNRTSIEVAYSGTNPYSLGIFQNAQQLLGTWGIDWLLPVPPSEPRTDGLTYRNNTEGERNSRVSPEEV